MVVVLSVHFLLGLLGFVCLVFAWYVGLAALLFFWPAIWIGAATTKNRNGKWGWLAFWVTFGVAAAEMALVKPWPTIMSYLWLIMPPGYYWRQAKKRRERTNGSAANSLQSGRAEFDDVAEFQEVLTERLRVLGPDDPDTLAARSNLAYARGESGDRAGAAAAFQELLTDQLRVLGPDHADTLATRSSLAAWRVESGDLAGAAAEFEELLTDRLRVLGPDHPDTLATRSNLVLRRDDPASAAAAFQELLTDHIRILGGAHPNTLAVRWNLAICRGESGDPAGAAAAFQELLTDQLEVLGPDHPDTLTTRNNLAALRGESGDPAGAAAAFQELLTDQLRVLGPSHPDTLTTRSNLARAHRAVISQICRRRLRWKLRSGVGASSAR